MIGSIALSLMLGCVQIVRSYAAMTSYLSIAEGTVSSISIASISNELPSLQRLYYSIEITDLQS